MPEVKIRTPRKLSPYALIQEFLRDDPWHLLVACIMLNQTSAKQVHRVMHHFFERWPLPQDFILSDEEEVKSVIQPLGFKNRRYQRLMNMTRDFINNETAGTRLNPLQLHGIGKYGADSYKMFCEGYLVPDVLDKELKNYVRWAKEELRRDSGSECDIS